MAGISWEHLRELAAFKAKDGCAVSLYVNLEPAEAPTPAALETRINAELAEAERLAGERTPALTHEQREALRADIERIRAWFADGFERDGARGVAVFADSLDHLWSTLALPAGVRGATSIADDLLVAPLARIAGRDGALVATVGRERGQVYRLRNGSLVEIADETDDVPGRHDQGGWSQARYERHIENIVGRHLRQVAETLDLCVQRVRGVPVALVGTEEIRPELEGLLSKEAKDRLAGWTTVEAHADARRLLEVVRPLLEDWSLQKEARLLDHWRQEAGTGNRGVSGWEATLEAASDGRIELLLVQDGVDRPAYQCPNDGRAQTTGGSCPLDGATLERRPSGVDVAVHLTLAHGGTVHVSADRQDLAPVGGIAALLRF